MSMKATLLKFYAGDADEAIDQCSSDHDQAENAVDDPYAILNVSPEATMAEIKAAYRLAIVKCHPDTVADRSITIREAAEAEAQRLNVAYDTIRNEKGCR
ncbi:J domain-containing protein [Bradyrhizobium sp. 38]|uniref:J domain-containing protein n=1 Tax=unclassified Bradyrhizobium TaxID=2631580 RepID=UPI001FFBF2AB|nr:MULTISPECIES: J domain-containing protein [unclassified Bradyrhizobium]MCK1337685.1 J domain-containing protein [Bradyrhizobium sp. 38]MCK1775703.1 J domain-containing protein [Bradyrhizobium sp. 132]